MSHQSHTPRRIGWIGWHDGSASPRCSRRPDRGLAAHHPRPSATRAAGPQLREARRWYWPQHGRRNKDLRAAGRRRASSIQARTCQSPDIARHTATAIINIAVLELEPLDGPRSTVAGDNDNLAKAIQAALNEHAYKVHRQITGLHVCRHPKASQLRLPRSGGHLP